MDGQYFVKRNYTSDGGEERFLQLAPGVIKYAPDQDHILTKYRTCRNIYSLDNFAEIKGVVYGKVTSTMIKDSNKTYKPWLCFSLIG